MNREELKKLIDETATLEERKAATWSMALEAITDAILPHLQTTPDLSKRQAFDKPDDSSVRWWFVPKGSKMPPQEMIVRPEKRYTYHKQDGEFVSAVQYCRDGDYYPADQDIPWPTAPPKPKPLPPLETKTVRRKSDGKLFHLLGKFACSEETDSPNLIVGDGAVPDNPRSMRAWASDDALARDYEIIEPEAT